MKGKGDMASVKCSLGEGADTLKELLVRKVLLVIRLFEILRTIPCTISPEMSRKLWVPQVDVAYPLPDREPFSFRCRDFQNPEDRKDILWKIVDMSYEASCAGSGRLWADSQAQATTGHRQSPAMILVIPNKRQFSSIVSGT